MITSDDDTAAQKPSDALKVLLIEDSPRLVDRLREIIDGIGGVEVIGTADTEGDAIREAKQQQPDVMLLDLQLRQGTGFEVMRQLRGTEVNPITIVMTNYALPEYRRLAMELGAFRFLDKTNEFDQLPDLLRQIRQALPQEH